MRYHWHYYSRRYDKALDSLGGHQFRAAVDVCALVITILGCVSKMATFTSVSGEMTLYFRCVNFIFI